MLERRWQPAGRLPTEALHVPGFDAGFASCSNSSVFDTAEQQCRSVLKQRCACIENAC
jgi:hypothetical protein